MILYAATKQGRTSAADFARRTLRSGECPGDMRAVGCDAERLRNLALGFPNPYWYRDCLLSFHLDQQPYAWFVCNPSLSTPNAWDAAGLLSRYPGSAAEAYWVAELGGTRQASYTSRGYDDYYQPPITPPQGIDLSPTSTYQAPPPPPPATPRMTFQNLTTGNPAFFYVGDRWRIVITAAPGSAVRYVGGKSGTQQSVQAGTVGSNGTLVLEGEPATVDVGTWAETWYAGNESVGTFSFSVAPRPATMPPPQTVYQPYRPYLPPSRGGSPDATGYEQIGAPSDTSLTPPDSEDEAAPPPSQWDMAAMFEKVKQYWWLAALAAGYLAFQQRGYRR